MPTFKRRTYDFLSSTNYTDTDNNNVKIISQHDSGGGVLQVNKMVLSSFNPLLKSILEDICDCKEVSIVIPDLDSKSSRILASVFNCPFDQKSLDIDEGNKKLIQEFGFILPWRDVKASIHVKEDAEDVITNKIKDLRLEVVGGVENSRNCSEADLFISDDDDYLIENDDTNKCLNSTVSNVNYNPNNNNCKINDYAQVPSIALSSNDTVFEDCIESFHSTSISSQTRNCSQTNEENSEKSENISIDKVDSSESLTEDLHNHGDKSSSQLSFQNDDLKEDQEFSKLEKSVQVDSFSEDEDINDNIEESVGGEIDQSFEESNCEEEEETEESDDDDDDDDTGSSWEAETENSDSDLSDDEDQKENKNPAKKKECKGKSLINIEKVEDLSVVEANSLSFYLSETGPIDIRVRCGCGGSCIRSCPCKAAGVPCSRWCKCDNFKCKSKISQREGNRAVSQSLCEAKSSSTKSFLHPAASYTPRTIPSDDKIKNSAAEEPTAEADTHEPGVSSQESLLTPTNPKASTSCTNQELTTTPTNLLGPPLSCSTINVSMSTKRKKKLFTDKVGPQELN